MSTKKKQFQKEFSYNLKYVDYFSGLIIAVKMRHKISQVQK